MSLFQLGVMQEQYNKRILDYQHKIDELRKEAGLYSPENDARSPKKMRRKRQEEDIELIKDESNNMERSRIVDIYQSNSTTAKRKLFPEQSSCSEKQAG